MVPLVPGLLVFVPTGQPSGLTLHCQTPTRQNPPEVYYPQASLRDILHYFQRLSVCSCRGIESGRDRQGTRNTALINNLPSTYQELSIRYLPRNGVQYRARCTAETSNMPVISSDSWLSWKLRHCRSLQSREPNHHGHDTNN